MWFALGLLAAGLIALMVMGAVWRRAVRLTTRRVSEVVPTDVTSVRAEMDLRSARFAQDIRRVELAMADLRRRNAEERIETGRRRAEVDRVNLELRAEIDARLAGEARESALGAELEGRDRRLEEAATRIGELDERIASLEADLGAREAAARVAAQSHAETLTEMAGERDAIVAELERELSAGRTRAAEAARRIETLEGQIEAQRQQIGGLTSRFEAENVARRLAETTAEQERDRADRLDRRIERLVSDVAQREELADRRLRETERAREALSSANARIAALSGHGGDGVAAGDNVLRTLAQLEERNRDLEARLKAAEAAGAAGAGESPAASADPSRAALRDQLADLAAEVVGLTRALEGGRSPIDRIAAGADAGGGPERSLAERIRALRTRGTRAPERA